MPAQIVSIPSPAASTAKIASSSSNPTDSGTLATDAAGSGGGVGSFGNLFQQMLAKQQVLDASILPGEALGTSVSTSEDLAALLPFMEGMGLIQQDRKKGEANGLTEENEGASPAGIPFILTQPVITDPAISAAAKAVEGAGESLQLTAAALDGQKLQLTLPRDTGNDQQLAAANEFSSRLDAAIELVADNKVTELQSPVTAHSANAAHTSVQTTVLATPALPVEKPVGVAGWDQEVGNRIVWMANKTESRAELVLTPPQMGRVEVSLSVTGDQASATFVSGNAAVREALEAALPRLREVLAEAGIQLGQAQVGSENSQQAAQQEKNRDNFGSAHDVPADNAKTSQARSIALPASPGLKIGHGLVDVFA